MQPELFPGWEAQAARKRSSAALFPHRYLRVRLAYEDLIIASLAGILVVLGGFCLGVERGRALTLVAPSSGLGKGSPPTANELRLAPVATPPRSVAQAVDRYAIQLASYLDRQPAEREAQRLRKQGFNAQIVKNGRYFELRVGGYPTKDEALLSLAALKRTYHDGFVKRVS